MYFPLGFKFIFFSLFFSLVVRGIYREIRARRRTPPTKVSLRASFRLFFFAFLRLFFLPFFCLKRERVERDQHNTTTATKIHIRTGKKETTMGWADEAEEELDDSMLPSYALEEKKKKSLNEEKKDPVEVEKETGGKEVSSSANDDGKPKSPRRC